MTFSSSDVSKNCNRSEVETVHVGRVWWEADAHPVLKVEVKGQSRYKVMRKKWDPILLEV